jgi:hypothetical protein
MMRSSLVLGGQVAGQANLLIGKLPEADRMLLRASCQPIELRGGQQLGVGGTAFVCFPQGAIISLVDGRGVELGLVGHEGMSSWSVLLGSVDHEVRGLVERSGTALAIHKPGLMDLCRISPQIRAMVLHFVELLAAQMVATITSTARHSVGRRIARRLLMLHDRSLEDAMDLTHEQLGRALGVRRASVTDSLHILEGDRILRCTRNRVCVLDRPGLESAAGSAYGAAERSYRSMIGPFGKSAGSPDADAPAAPPDG